MKIKIQKRVQESTWKVQMPLPNILLNKGKYQQNDEERLNFSTISDISHISQVHADKPKQ